MFQATQQVGCIKKELRKKAKYDDMAYDIYDELDEIDDWDIDYGKRTSFA